MATIYQVSELAGVSLATVSRVMNNNAKVSEKTAAKVRAAMEQLGYRPNAMAQSLASNRSNSVGILVSELHGPFYGSMMSAIEIQLRASAKHAIITAGHSNEKDERDGIEFLIGRSCDALIMHVEAVSDEYLIELSQGTTPIFLINRLIPEISGRCISLNNESGGYLATKSLIEQGHKDLAYISGPQWKDDARQRLAGHKRALEESGIALNQTLIVEGDFTETGGCDAMTQLLNKKLPMTAVVCANDEMACGAMGIIREHGLSIPNDISVIGFDNVTFASYLYPKLSTIDYPIYNMGQMAARLVLKTVYKKDLEIEHLFEPQLITRNSVKDVRG
jgi:LacI family transcriptional regulator